MDLSEKMGSSESDQVTAQISAARLAKEKEMLESQNKWLNSELSAKSNELLELRKQQTSQFVHLQTQLREAQDQSSLAQESNRNLKDRLAEREREILSLHDKLKASREELLLDIEKLQQEANSQAKLASLYKESSEESQRKLVELQRKHESFRKSSEDKIASLMTELERWKELCKTSESEIAELRNRIGQITSASAASATVIFSPGQQQQQQASSSSSSNDDVAPNPILFTPATPGTGNVFVPTASPVSIKVASQLSQGLSTTNIYSKYVEATQEAAMLREENKRQSEIMNQILLEIEHKAPMLQQQREDYERLMQESTLVTKKLQLTTQDLEVARYELDRIRKSSAQMEMTIVEFQQENDRLSTQVQALLKECTEFRTGRSIEYGSRSEGGFDGNAANLALATDVIVSEELINFRNIEDIQKKNRTLWRQLKALETRYEREVRVLEANLRTEYNAKFQMAAKEVEELQNKNKKHAEMLATIVLQRDMYRSLLREEQRNQERSKERDAQQEQEEQQQQRQQQQQQSQQQQSVEAIENQAETMREMQKRFEEFTKTIQDQLNVEREQRQKVSMMLARKEADVLIFEERCKRLQESVDSQLAELRHIREEKSKLIHSLGEFQKQNDSLSHRLIARESDIKQMEHGLANLTADRDFLKARCDSLLQEKAMLSRESAQHDKVLENLRLIKEGIDFSEARAKRNLADELETVRQEVQFLRKQNEELKMQNREKLADLENSNLDLKQTLHVKEDILKRLQDDLSQAKSQLSSTKTVNDSLKDEVGRLDQKLAIVLSARGSFQSDSAPQGDKVAEIDQTNARHEISILQQLLEQEKKHASEASKMAMANEEALRQMRESSDEYRQRAETMLEKQRVEIEKFNTELAAARQTVQESTQNRDDRLSILIRDKQTLEEANAALQTKIRHLEEQHSESEKRIAALREDLGRHVAMWRESQTNYEQEVIKHAASVESLSTLSKKIQALETELISSREELRALEGKTKSSEANWSEQRTTLQNQIKENETRIQDLMRINDVLHSRFENVNEQLKKLQSTESLVFSSDVMMMSVDHPASTAAAATSSSSSSSAGTAASISSAEEELREIVAFLRREKEIAETKLSMANQELKLSNQKVEHLMRQVEQARAELKMELDRRQEGVMSDSELRNLRQQVAQLNLIRESNSALRQENEKNAKAAQEWEARATALEMQINPMREQVILRNSEKKALEEEATAMRSEAETWKNKFKEIVQKYKQIDPEEHVKLQQENENLKQDVQRLTTELEAITQRFKIVEEKFNRQKTIAEKLKADLLTEKNRVQEMTKSNAAQIETFKSQIEVLKAQNESLKSGPANAAQAKLNLVSKELSQLNGVELLLLLLLDDSADISVLPSLAG